MVDGLWVMVLEFMIAGSGFEGLGTGVWGIIK
jgi:hypothetical protein